MNRIKKMFHARRFRAGGYAAFAAAVVVVIAVLVNMMVGALPANLTQFDVTTQSLFTLSDQTKQIVKALQQDVKLELLAYSGSENSDVVKLLEQYEALSDHIKVSQIDPAVNPGVLETYADEDLYANSVIVTCGDVYRFVSYADIMVYNYDDYYYTGSYTQEFAGESAITGAIHFVTSENLPKMYLLTGHGETELNDSLTDALEDDNFTVEELSLLTEESVPEDADAVLIYAPESDLSTEEADMLTAYIDAGGKVVLLTDVIDEAAMPNLLSVTGHMGLGVEPGLIVEGDSSHAVRGYSYYLLPEVQSHAATEPLIEKGYYVMMPMAQGIVQTGASGATVTAILSSTADSYAKADGYGMTTTEYEDGDVSGPFDVGVIAEAGEGKLVWFASSAMLGSSVDQMVSGANSDLFLNTLNWMCEQEESISIRAKDLSEPTLTMTAADANFWSVVFIGAIPAACVIAGIIIWIRRRRR